MKIFFQLTKNLGCIHTSEFPEPKDDKRFREWVKNGKPENKFDFVEMGLDMLVMPTRHFGWTAITETMKKVIICFLLSLKKKFFC
jgi:hypothetical protein